MLLLISRSDLEEMEYLVLAPILSKLLAKALSNLSQIFGH